LFLSFFFSFINLKKIDLCPRGSRWKRKDSPGEDFSISGQYTWFKSELYPILSQTRVPIYLIFGNSDRKFNYDLLKSELSSPLLTFVDNQVVSLPNEYLLFGYSLVPGSNHTWKDYEKLDLGNQDFNERKLVLHGLVSISGKAEPGSIKTDENETISWDFQHLPFECDSQILKKMVWMTHAPPFGTNLDICKEKIHVGSRAIFSAIKNFQPLVTLHGHIHETVEQSGSYQSSIGRTICLTAGNHYSNELVNLISLNLEDPKNAKRISL